MLTLDKEMNSNINRDNLLQMLRNRFIMNFNIDNQVLFSRKRMYILMFDLKDPEKESPTLSIEEDKNIQIIRNVS